MLLTDVQYVLFLFCEFCGSVCEFRSAHFVNTLKELNSSKDNDDNSGISVRGVLECAVHAAVEDASGFYFDADRNRCSAEKETQTSGGNEDEMHWIIYLNTNFTIDSCYLENKYLNWRSDGSCFKVRNDTKGSQVAARSYCSFSYATLAKHGNQERIRAMKNCMLSKGKGFEPFWIGLRVKTTMEDAVWPDNLKLGGRVADWPWDDVVGAGQCVSVDTGNRFLWRKEDCNKTLNYLCELPLDECK